MVVQIKGKQVRLGIQAPKETKIHRQEVYEAIQTSNKEAAEASPKSVSQVAEMLKRGSAQGSEGKNS
jgi:carbon storage regulator